ncbi:hypothetical protein EMGBD3_09870, partial [Nitrosarchaeum sp.]
MEDKSSIFFLVFSLPAIFFIIVTSNMIAHSYAELWSNTLNLVITSILLVACIVNNFKTGTRGKHGRAWMCFTLAIAMWWIAERTWTLNELTNTETLSYADLFWFGGYVFYFIFGVMYLMPFASQISRKNIVIVSLVVLSVLMLVLYITKSNIGTFEEIAHTSYPVADSIMLIPSVLGIMLFFKGRMKFSVSLFFIGMLSFVISDYGFMYLIVLGNIIQAILWI